MRTSITPRLYATGVVTAALVCALIPVGRATSDEAEGQLPMPGLPLRLTAVAVGMVSVTPGTTAKLEIDITRWSTTSEREELGATLTQKGPEALLSALKQMPFHGHMAIPRWVGPDPHNARLGWDLRYASHTPLDNGRQRIALATDRFVGFWEARETRNAIAYPFTVIEIHVDTGGRGTGKMSVSTKIDIDRATGELLLDNYASAPVRLTDVTIAR